MSAASRVLSANSPAVLTQKRDSLRADWAPVRGHPQEIFSNHSTNHEFSSRQIGEWGR
jgi:hypothetical protein